MLSEKSIESLEALVLKFPSRMFQIDFPDLQAFTSEGSSLRFCDGFWKCFVAAKCTFFKFSQTHWTPHICNASSPCIRVKSARPLDKVLVGKYCSKAQIHESMAKCKYRSLFCLPRKAIWSSKRLHKIPFPRLHFFLRSLKRNCSTHDVHRVGKRESRKALQMFTWKLFSCSHSKAFSFLRFPAFFYPL